MTPPSMRDRLDTFLFQPANPRAVGLFRAALALMLAAVFWPKQQPLVEWLASIPQVDAFYDQVYRTPGWWSISLVIIGLFGIGWRPRAAGALLAVLLLPGIFGIYFGLSRQLLYIVMLALCLLRSDLGFGLFTSRTAQQGTVCGPIWPIRLLQLQVSLLYLYNALAKLNPRYLDGTELIEMSRVYSHFQVDLTSGFLELGPLAIPAWVGAVATVLIELFLAIGFWFRRTRVATALVGLAFHVFLKLLIQIGWLDWASVFLYLVFLLPFEKSKCSSPLGSLSCEVS